jgi:NAD(P)-dependent dehydrogenase (short-subunit alcohol dehydrogenase family)
VITGSSCSIGAAIAKHFGEQGAKVVVERLARILAKDPSLGAKGITVNTISPGPVQAAGCD